MEEKKEIEENLEKKKTETFWSKIPPLFLIGAGVIIFLIFINLSKTQNISYIWWIIGIIVILFFMSKVASPTLKPVDPREADILVERDIKRKMCWDQWARGTKWKIGPVSDHAHTDARGAYYDVAVEIKEPYTDVKYWVAKVMSQGDERGYVYWRKAISEITGRDTQQERTITRVPAWVTNSQKYPAWGDFLRRKT